MDGFKIENDKITRKISPYETVYLINDVRYFFAHWKEYYKEIINKTPAETRQPYENALSTVELLEKDFFS